MTLHAPAFAASARSVAAALHTHSEICALFGLHVGDAIRFRWRDDPRLLVGTIVTEPCGSRERPDGRRPRHVDGSKQLNVEAVLAGRDHMDIQLAGHIAYCGVPLAWCILPAATALTLFEETAGGLR